MARRWNVGAFVLAGAVALAHPGTPWRASSGEDCVAYTTLASVFQRWGNRILPVVPERVALVGWGFAKDPVFWIRAERSVIMVDPRDDGAAGLADTLDALDAHGWSPFFYGYGDELASIVRPRLQGRYRTVELLQDPPLWRLERVKTP